MASSTPLRLGTRGSPLALAQAGLVRDRLAALGAAVEILPIRTTGDAILDRPLAEIGGKGLFTKEIDEALLEGRIDLAVHSLKDVPTQLPEAIVLAAVLEREDVRDAFISHKAPSLDDLPAGSVIGTASLRRQAQILHRRPDLEVVPMRGNVQTRLRKLEQGEVDALLLALAGLKRLGLAGEATAILDPWVMLPAVAQGAIGVTCRASDGAAETVLAKLDHRPTRMMVLAERALLAALEGSCRTPIACLAQVEGADGLALRARIARPDGTELLEAVRRGRQSDAEALGRDAGAELRRRAGLGFFPG